MATCAQIFRHTPAVILVLATAACEMKGTQGTALAVIAKEGSEISSFPRECAIAAAGEGGTGGPAKPSPGDASEEALCDYLWDTPCAFPGIKELWNFVQPEISGELIPTGSGGEILPGTYQLESFVEYGDTSHCLISSGMRRSQALRIGPRSGWLDDEDNHYLHWPMTFSYSTAGPNISMSIKCEPYGGSVKTNKPYGPFGPFETYTATSTHLRLFSPVCRYQAKFRRVSP